MTIVTLFAFRVIVGLALQRNCLCVVTFAADFCGHHREVNERCEQLFPLVLKHA